MSGKRVAVVGGGISGLCVAFKLKNEGIDVLLYESGSVVGGNIKTECRDGFLIEHGPNSTPASVELFRLLNELGIADRIAPPSKAAKNRYILKNGKLVALPSSAFDLLKAEVFSVKARLRLLKEPFVRSSSPAGETVADFFERRFGKEIVDYAVDPFISGIYAGDPHQLSIKSAFPRLFEMERVHGSFLKAGLLGRKDKKKKLPKGTPRSIAFKAGMQTLTNALFEQMRENIRLNTPVESIEKHGSEGYGIGGEMFDAVVVCTPAPTAAELIDSLDGRLARELENIYYPPVSVVFTGFKRDDVRFDPRGFGFLVPVGEGRRILGSLWTSSVFENRAPAGYHLFTTFVGGSRNFALCENSDAAVTRIVLDELRSIVGAEGEPAFIAVKKWPRAIPQYNVGYEAVSAAIERFMIGNPGMYLCSNYYKGISVGDCVKNGVSTAAEIMKFLST